LNPFNSNKIELQEYIKNFVSQSDNFTDFDSFSDSFKASIYANKSLGEDFMQKVGFDLNDTLLSCVYSNSECDSSNFWEFTTYDRGNCWSFNSIHYNSTLIINESGQFFGLTLELFTGFDGLLIHFYY